MRYQVVYSSNQYCTTWHASERERERGRENSNERSLSIRRLVHQDALVVYFELNVLKNSIYILPIG